MGPAVSGTADNLPQPYEPPPSTATSDDGMRGVSPNLC
jgi:hypothetical protein